MTLPINEYVVIVARHSGLTFDVQDAGYEYSPLQTCGHGGQPNREFIIQLEDGEYYTISARHSGLSLDVKDKGGEYATVQTCGHGGQDNRQWKFIQQPNGCYNIIVRHSGLGLDVRDARGEWSRVQTAGCGGQPNREFAIFTVAQYQNHTPMISKYLFATCHLPEDKVRRICMDCVNKVAAEMMVAPLFADKGKQLDDLLFEGGKEFVTEDTCSKCVDALFQACPAGSQNPPDNGGPDKSDGNTYIREHAGPPIGHEVVPADGHTDLPHIPGGEDHIA